MRHEFIRMLVVVSVEDVQRDEATLISSKGEEFVISMEFEWVP